MPDLNYWKKQEKPLFSDLEWNFPEQKQNSISVLGGNSGSFSAPVKASEFLKTNFPIRTVKTILPDSLKSKFPPALTMEDLIFLKSTPSGSFDKSEELNEAVASSDFTLVAGDLSKNSTTAVAISQAIKTVKTPVLITRDAVDLLVPEMSELAEKENLFIFASLAQLQKIFRVLYFPKVLLLSQPLLPVIETLHKFTLSYESLTLITFHEGQIIVASAGKIITTPLNVTEYSPISLFLGNLAGKIVAENLWNPKKPLEATAAAVLLQNSGRKDSDR